MKNKFLLATLVYLIPLVSAQELAEPVNIINWRALSLITIMIFITIFLGILFILRKNKKINGTKGGIIGFIVGLIISEISFLTGIGIIFAMPFAMLFCNRLYQCKEEWEGIMPSMIIGLIFLTLILIITGVLIGRYTNKN
jgi:hypothetical protein